LAGLHDRSDRCSRSGQSEGPLRLPDRPARHPAGLTRPSAFIPAAGAAHSMPRFAPLARRRRCGRPGAASRALTVERVRVG